ncbi:MAG: transcriptional regulator [Firmicutes bacterium]|nr:transcriptional regulator [Bacillota bacterium]
MKKIIAIAKKYAQTDATMLLLGESGTGKELFAQSIHNYSSRNREAFVAINCSALPGQLLESELFGYVGGAFTGARKEGKRGLFELAHNGTIFLDEIGDMDKELQSRLLRVLEEKQVRRIGSDSIIPVNVRVIAATNMDLWNEGVKGNFRLDLYFRLNVLNIKLPPLRERRADVALLAGCLLRRYCEQYGKKNMCLPMDVMERLQEHQWIGNIRELKNVVERIVLSSENGGVDPDTVDLMLDKHAVLPEKVKPVNDNDLLLGTMDEIKHKAAVLVLEQEGNNIARAARRLQIDRNTLKKILQ